MISIGLFGQSGACAATGDDDIQAVAAASARPPSSLRRFMPERVKNLIAMMFSSLVSISCGVVVAP
jgi:hypothetical protein